MRTDEDLNSIIAKWCGWKMVPARTNGPLIWMSPDGEKWDHENWEIYPPEYSTDLNAIHESIKERDEQWMRVYVDTLVCHMKPGEFTVNATARQRAEALVAVIEGEKK